VNPSECVANHFKTKQPHIDSTIKKALKNDSSFDVSSSLLFDSQPNVSKNANSAFSVISEARRSSLLLKLQVRPYSVIYFVKVGAKIQHHS